MNRQEQQRVASQWAAQWQAGGLPYTPPRCNVIPLETEDVLGITSVRHRAENSTEEEWEEDEEIRSSYDDNYNASMRLDW